MKAGGRTDEVAALLQGDAAAGLRVFQFLEIDEMAIDERGVGERPEMLGGLQLGRETMQRVADHLRERNIEVVIVDNGDEARLPHDAPVRSDMQRLSYFTSTERASLHLTSPRWVLRAPPAAAPADGK